MCGGAGSEITGAGRLMWTETSAARPRPDAANNQSAVMEVAANRRTGRIAMMFFNLSVILNG